MSGGGCECGKVGLGVERWCESGCGELGVGVMWEGVEMGSGYGVCEDRGCGNVGSVQM